MRLRHKTTGAVCHSNRFNVHSLNEIIVYFEDDCDSMFIRDFEIELGTGDQTYWKDLIQAFKDCDVITDNHNTRFFEPANEEDRRRGYSLH